MPKEADSLQGTVDVIKQALGINQVNNWLVQLDQVTQQNIVNAEESAAAALELSVKAYELAEILKQFNLKSMNRGGDLSSLDSLPPDVLNATKNLIAGSPAGTRASAADLPAPKPFLQKRGVKPDDIIPLDDFGMDIGRYKTIVEGFDPHFIYEKTTNWSR